MAANPPASRFQIDTIELRAIYQILNLLNLRNKNQHRRNGWWKWFSMLRRAVGKLLQDCDENVETPARTRIAFMNDHIFPKCYLSFTQLVADNQFSAVGLVLLAELARTRKAVGAPGWSAEGVFYPGEVDVGGVAKPKKALSEDVGEVLARLLDGDDLESPAASEDTFAGNLFDTTITEPERRKVHSADMTSPSLSIHGCSVGPVSDLHSGSPTLPKPASGRKKRRKPNLIDDLFEGLT